MSVERFELERLTIQIITEQLYSDGFVVIAGLNKDKVLSFLTDFKLGEIITPQPSKSNPYKEFLGSLFPHTDGPNLIESPVLVLNTCIKQASSGGETVWIPGSGIYNHLQERLSEDVFNKTFNVEFLQSADSVDDWYSPMFNRNNDKIEIRFRKPSRLKVVSKAHLAVFETAISFINNPANQTIFLLNKGESILMSNRSGLHGKTKHISDSARRMLLKTWTDGGTYQGGFEV
jgi:Taurine catabolism dioxygenase TauD, TfdA family